MADGAFGNLTVATPSGGVLHFVGPGAVLAGGYGLYKTNANQLQFQGGSGGFASRAATTAPS